MSFFYASRKGLAYEGTVNLIFLFDIGTTYKVPRGSDKVRGIICLTKLLC